MPDYSAAKTGLTCLPQRAALLKSMLNFLKKAIQDQALSDSIRHVMDGSLPNSLKHIISNAEYYGPSLFLLATGKLSAIAGLFSAIVRIDCNGCCEYWIRLCFLDFCTKKNVKSFEQTMKNVKKEYIFFEKFVYSFASVQMSAFLLPPSQLISLQNTQPPIFFYRCSDSLRVSRTFTFIVITR